MAKKPNPARGIRLHGVVYELNIQRNGVRQFINLETDNFGLAVERAERIRKDPTLQPTAGFSEEIDRFIAYKMRVKEYTAHTARTKKNKILLLKSFLHESTTAATVTPKQVQAWHDELVKEELHSSTIHGYMMSIRAFFNWTVEIAKIRRQNPVDDVRMIKLEGRARDSFCTYDQRDRLIRECEDEELQFILFCGFHAGFRFNEIVQAVEWWFDTAASRIDLRKTPTMRFKDSEERSIPMTIEFRRFLLKYGKRKPFMIAPDKTQGDWLYRYDFRAKFMAYVKSKGLPWVTPHIMRHTFASLLVSVGESIYKVAVWLGDDVRTVQKHYGHLAPDEGGIEKAFSKRHKRKDPVKRKNQAGKGSGHSPAESRSQAASKTLQS